MGLWTDHYLARRHLSNLCSGMGISSGFTVRKKKRKRSTDMEATDSILLI